MSTFSATKKTCPSTDAVRDPRSTLVYFTKRNFQNIAFIWFDLSASGVWTVSVYYNLSKMEYIVNSIVLGQHYTVNSEPHKS